MKHMQTRKLGWTDLELTTIGYGSWALGGGDWLWSWGPQDDQASVDTIVRSMELGINWIDTAPVYGLGHSEEVVGLALKKLPHRPILATKCSLVWDSSKKITAQLKRKSVRDELEASLRRLGVDVIDLYQIHWPTDDAQETDATWQTLADLQKEGKVRWIGVSNFNVEQMRRAMDIAKITSLQPFYSPIRREVEAAELPYCQREGIGVIVYSPMHSGLLSGAMTRERAKSLPEDDWRSRDPEFNEPKLSKNLILAERLGEIGKRHGRSAGEAAIAWTLRHPAVTGAIVGMRNIQHVEGVIGAADFQLSEAEIKMIAEVLP
jgi:aryl-alcohol dehydrogenase-like predicted oxidoreductase